jgi:hypothetical protein
MFAALIFSASVSAQQVEAESRHRPKSPVHDPLAAWQQALLSLTHDARIRRLAFAEHILFVFHSPPDDNGKTGVRILFAPVFTCTLTSVFGANYRQCPCALANRFWQR